MMNVQNFDITVHLRSLNYDTNVEKETKTFCSVTPEQESLIMVSLAASMYAIVSCM